MNKIRLKKIKLLMFHSGCHGNKVAIATSYEADAYRLNEPLCQMWTQYDLSKGVIDVSLWLQ